MSGPVTRPVAAGLALALGAPAALPFLVRLVPGGPVARAVAGQLGLWLLLGAIAALVRRGERRPLASLGIRPPGVASFVWGIAAAAALVAVIVPLSTRLVAALGLAGFESGLAAVGAWPLWLRVAAVLTGGLAEEVCYRGYGITRLEAVTGSTALAAALTVAVFAVAHAPLWGPGPVVSFLGSGGFLAALFVWRRDLLANVVAHVAVDTLGLVLGPAGGR